MSSTPTVLIIEDDPVFRRVLSFTVAKSGLAVETANDGQFGFERLMQGGIDFMVTDHQMPRCGGVELLQRLKDMSNYQRPPAILCTAKGLELDSEKLRNDFGLTEIMHKPFSPRKLSEVIAEHVHRDVHTADVTVPALPQPPAPITFPQVTGLGSMFPPQGCGDG